LSPSTAADHSADDGIDLTPALPGFYCKNKGHRPSYIPSLRVNDGICDYDVCCDGSDEWAHVGGVKCEDRCKDIGKEWRKTEEKRQKSLSSALKKKKELVAEAGRLTKEIEDRIVDLGVEEKAAEAKIKSMEADLEKLEKQERGKVVKGAKKGKVGVLAGLAKGRVDELRAALAEVRAQRDESRSRVSELEEILSKFKVEYNPNFNDEGVKRAVRSWEDYAAKGTAGDYSAEAAQDRDLEEIAKEDSETSGIHWQEWENEDEGEIDLGQFNSQLPKRPSLTSSTVYKLLAYFPPSLVEFLEDKFYTFKAFLVANNIIPGSDESSRGESKAVSEARDALNSEKSFLEDRRRSVREHMADLEKDYGPQGVFRPLKDVCIQKDSGEYTYEHCFLANTKQIPKKSGATVTMGNFNRITSILVDEADSAGKIQQREKTAIEYTSGQQCWNGPARSTTVILECSEENEILKVMEDEKCVYSMIVTTPAVCENGSGNDSNSRKDEL
jgi:protein kinase C substrate 80K-H